MKFLFLAFLGIHVPLIGLIIFVAFFETFLSPSLVLSVTLIFTLVATVATLMLLKRLISPIETTSKALEDYRENRKIPKLPTEFSDEAGMLMTNIISTIRNNEKLLSEKQDTIYLLSHDLKNFAESPASLAKLIAEENVSDKIKEYSQMIIKSSERQIDFLESFITLLHDEEQISKKIIRINTIDFSEIASSVKTLFEPKLLAKNIKLNIKVKTEGVALRADKELLNQVLVNLIDNAIKFSYPDSEINVEIKREHSVLKIKVVDSGIGFENTRSLDLFKKFSPMSRLGTANEKSTGIGLYLCSQIVKKSDGAIYAESNGKDKGSVFYIDLKVYRRK